MNILFANLYIHSYHLTQCELRIRLLLFLKSTALFFFLAIHLESAREDVEKGAPFTLLLGMQTGAATVERSMEITKKN